VANYGSATITKLRASDGALLGAFSVGGTYPQLVAIGAGKVWVTIDLVNTVTALRLSDGSLFGNFPVGDRPKGVAFDGHQIWTANKDGQTLTVLQASDGALVDTVPAPYYPDHVIHAGANIYVTNDSAPNFNVERVQARTLTNKGAFPVGRTPFGLASDGTSIWVANYYDNTVTKITFGP